MKTFAIAIGLVQGLVAVGLLYLFEAVVRAFRPEWSMPFSEWWGLVFCVPGFAMAVFAHRNEL